MLSGSWLATSARSIGLTTGATFCSLFWITFHLKLFSALLQNSNKLQTGPTWESRVRTASLSLQQTGLAATWQVTSKTQQPTDCQQVPWQQSNPRPGYLKALNVRTVGLHSACSTSNCTADRITQYYIPAGWIIPTTKTSSSQLNEQ